MPSVYTFSRTDNEILEELLKVFSATRGPAKEQWSIQAELLVEPVGWDGLWKLSKESCKKFEVRFPCVAYVSVTSVDYGSLSASVDILRVQHELVSLPEMVDDVPLIDLWPTEKQREPCINAATTAEFIDLLRFYYTNIWMPWDDQDDKFLLPTTVEERMKLWVDLHNGRIPNCVARAITMLRNSAINAHEKIKELDASLCDGANEDDSLLPPSYITSCAELSAHLDGLMSKWTLYENPLIREQYLEKVKNKWQHNKSHRNVVALWEGGSIFEFEAISQYLRCQVSSDQRLSVLADCEEALRLEPEELVVCSKSYQLPEQALANISICSFNGSILKATEMRSCLLMLSEEGRVRDVTLVCDSVNTVLVMRCGTLSLDNCVFYDEGNTTQCDFATGIVAMAGAKIVIRDCTFDNFYSGIVVHKKAQVELRNCTFKRCGVGIQMYEGAKVSLDTVTITESTEQSIRCEMTLSTERKSTHSIQDLVMKNCRIGNGDLEREILIVQQDSNI